MPRVCTSLIRGAGILCGLLLATSLYAQSTGQTTRGRVNRMEIYNGLNRTVRYHGENLSPGEESTLREMERSENELFYVRNMQTLKSEYVVGESVQDAHRRNVQLLLYGLNFNTNSYGASAFPGGYYGRARYPYMAGMWPGAYTGYGAGYGAGYGGVNGIIGSSSSINGSLANGVGDEGRLKTAMSPMIAAQATPEYAAAVIQAYEQASLRATESPTLVNALNLPSARALIVKRERSAAAVAGPWVRLVLKNGSQVDGVSFEERGDWYIVYRNKDKSVQTRIRQGDVARLDSGHSAGIVPAVRP